MKDLTKQWESDETDVDFWDVDADPVYLTHQSIGDAVRDTYEVDNPEDEYEWATLKSPLKVYGWRALAANRQYDEFPCELVGFVVLQRTVLLSLVQPDVEVAS